jgi:hypothetical protein
MLDPRSIYSFSLFGTNRGEEIPRLQREVFRSIPRPYYPFAHKQIEAPFPAGSHGHWLNEAVTRIFNSGYEAIILWDIDCIPVNANIGSFIYSALNLQDTIIGAAQQSNHIIKANGTHQHTYAGPCFFGITKKTYMKLGCPSFDFTPRSDCAEEITWLAQEKGLNVLNIWPTDVKDPIWPLDNNLRFGIGTTYGGLVYHQFCLDRPESVKMFVDRAEEAKRYFASLI